MRARSIRLYAHAALCSPPLQWWIAQYIREAGLATTDIQTADLVFIDTYCERTAGLDALAQPPLGSACTPSALTHSALPLCFPGYQLWYQTCLHDLHRSPNATCPPRDYLPQMLSFVANSARFQVWNARLPHQPGALSMHAHQSGAVTPHVHTSRASVFAARARRRLCDCQLASSRGLAHEPLRLWSRARRVPGAPQGAWL